MAIIDSPRGSIEYKHQNISAVLKGLGEDWIPGHRRTAMRRGSTNLSRDARPNAKTPPGVLHDLDNIVRDYLIPGIVPAFGTVSDQRWTIDFASCALAIRSSPMPGARTRRRRPEQGTA